MSFFKKKLTDDELRSYFMSNSIDLGHSICCADYNGYKKLKGYFTKFIHLIDYPNFKQIDESAGNFLILNAEEFPQSTVREIDKFAFFSRDERDERLFEPILIHAEDINSIAAVAIMCKTTRGCEFFEAIGDVCRKMYQTMNKFPSFIPSQMESVLKYYGKKIADQEKMKRLNF